MEKIISWFYAGFGKPSIFTGVKTTVKKIRMRLWRILWKTMLWFFGLSILSVILFRFIPVPFTPLMIIRSCEQLSDGEDIKLKKDWVSRNEISPHLSLAVVASEDQRFPDHFGFDFDAIEKAVEHNQKKKKRTVRGASTISQQTAKNVFLWPGRSWFRKGLEVYFTLLIELFWSKERILEVYLNVIETGNGIYGAEASARHYFNKPAKKLTRHEAALIAAVLPAPRKWSVTKPSSAVLRRQAWIVRNMYNLEKVEL